MSQFEERRFQIELTRLQMKHEAKLIVLFGILILEFSIFGVLYALLYIMFNPWSLVTIIGLIAIILLTIFSYSRELQAIEKETQDLIKKYTW